MDESSTQRNNNFAPHENNQIGVEFGPKTPDFLSKSHFFILTTTS